MNCTVYLRARKGVFQLNQREGPRGVGMALGSGVPVITILCNVITALPIHLPMTNPPVGQFFPFGGKSRLTDGRLEESITEKML